MNMYKNRIQGLISKAIFAYVTKCREIKLLCKHITTEEAWESVMLSGCACYTYRTLCI